MSKNKRLKRSEFPNINPAILQMSNQTSNDTPQEPAVVQTQTVQSNDFLSAIEQLKVTGTQAQKSLISGIEAYRSKMGPSANIEPNNGAREQYLFWKLISSIAENTSNEDFKKTWNLLLAYFEHYKNEVFHERYVFRFSEYWTWSEDDLNAFQRILNLIKLTANPSERSTNIAQVSVDRSLSVGFSDEARQRIVSFYI